MYRYGVYVFNPQFNLIIDALLEKVHLFLVSTFCECFVFIFHLNCLPVFLSICFSVHPSVALSVCASVCLSVCLSLIISSACANVCLSLFPCICLCVCAPFSLMSVLSYSISERNISSFSVSFTWASLVCLFSKILPHVSVCTLFERKRRLHSEWSVLQRPVHIRKM